MAAGGEGTTIAYPSRLWRAPIDATSFPAFAVLLLKLEERVQRARTQASMQTQGRCESQSTLLRKLKCCRK